MLSVLLSLCAIASGGGFLAEVGEPVELDSGGTWSRPMLVEGQWKLGVASNGDFFLTDIDRQGFNELSVDRAQQTQLTFHGGLKDHSIKRCPDGTWLHIATSSELDDSDSASAFRYSASMEPLAEGVVEEGVTGTPHHDPPAVCSRLAQGVAFPGPRETDPSGDGTFHHVALDATVSHTSVTPGDPRASGSSLFTEPDRDVMLLVGFVWEPAMRVVELDADFNELSRRYVELLDDPLRTYWPQALLRVEEHYLLAFMGRDDDEAGGDTGNVFLGVFDLDWQVLQLDQLTDFHESDGAMRPWLARRGAQVLLGFDRGNTHYLQELTLDADALGMGGDDQDTGLNPTELPLDEEPEDTGEPDSGESSGEPSSPASPEQGCGACRSQPGSWTPSGGALILLAAIAAVRRKGRGEAPQRLGGLGQTPVSTTPR